jgi:hypothetical protein
VFTETATGSAPLDANTLTSSRLIGLASGGLDAEPLPV